MKPGGLTTLQCNCLKKSGQAKEVMVKLQAYDMHDNLITNFAKQARSLRFQFQVRNSGAALNLKGCVIHGGSAGITITGNKAKQLCFLF